MSMTEANLNNASFQMGCNLATHYSVFVQSVTQAKGEGLGAGPRRAPTI